MALPPNGCVYEEGDFAPADFSGADFDLGTMVCGPYFVQVQDEYSQTQAIDVYSNTPAQDVAQES